MRQLFTLLFLLFVAQTGFSQVSPFPVDPGFRQAANTVSTISRGLRTAKEEQERKQQQEELEAQYGDIVANADTLFQQKRYDEAIREYTRALGIRQEQYPKDQIARANAENARMKKEEYQLLVDKADSLYNQMSYTEAIELYNEALAKKPLQYPRDQINNANAAIARWKTVHFSGVLISDTRVDDQSSKAFSNDPYSDFVKPGKYELTERYLVYSIYQKVDGIAVPAGMRLVIYSEPNFKGTVLLDVTGPVIINNSEQKYNGQLAGIETKEFGYGLQTVFPQSTRKWSKTDMNTWGSGSMEIIAVP